MQLLRLWLSHFRNYTELELEPRSGLNVFVGPNAQGKSNLLEAIALLGTGKSFRTNRDAETVQEGCTEAQLVGDARVRAGEIALACGIAREPRTTRKTYTVNGRSVRYAGYLGKLAVVTFVPSDLQLASGAPALRRAMLNAAIAQIEPGYYHELARYRKTLLQKNALLRSEGEFDDELLAVYDGALVEAGTAIVLARAQFVAQLAASAAAAHAQFTDGAERLGVEYQPNVAFESADAHAIGAAYAARLRAVAERERARGASIAGPHRDDLRLTIDGRELAVFGSQGQQRTAVLALKLGEYAVMRERSNEAPLLLLDDVLSELDERRSAAFLTGVGEYQQAFVTATHRPPQLPHDAHLYAIRAAHVLTEAPC